MTDLDTAVRVRMLEELVSVLYIEHFSRMADPIKAVAAHAESFHAHMDAKIEGTPENYAMLAQAQFAAFFETVQRRLREATGQNR